ncbi:unnamed protein product, partial [Mesorhabditis spiculigera]
MRPGLELETATPRKVLNALQNENNKNAIKPVDRAAVFPSIRNMANRSTASASTTNGPDFISKGVKRPSTAESAAGTPRKRSTNAGNDAALRASASKGPASERKKKTNKRSSATGAAEGEVPKRKAAYFLAGRRDRREDFLKGIDLGGDEDSSEWKLPEDDKIVPAGLVRKPWVSLKDAGQTAHRQRQAVRYSNFKAGSDGGSERNEYEVEQIIAMAKDPAGTPHYLLLWKHWGPNEATWQLKSDVVDTAPDLSMQYTERNKALDQVVKHLTKDQKASCRRFEFTYDMIGRGLDTPESRKTWKMLHLEKTYNEVLSAAAHPPVWVENWTKTNVPFVPPGPFHYITANVYSAGATAALEKLTGVDHHTYCECFIDDGSRRMRGSGFKPRCVDRVYRILRTSGDAIQQCTSDCCPDGCDQRVLTEDGPPIPLILFHEGAKGYGVRTPFDIPKNAYVGEYVGEVLTSEEADHPSRRTIYQHNLTGTHEVLGKGPLVIDSQHFGNITRFINHSCDPNVSTRPVIWSHHGNYNVKMAFFALRNIEAGEELTAAFVSDTDKRTKCTVRCLCGTKNCRGWLPGAPIPTADSGSAARE